MNKTAGKLIAAVLALVLSAILVVTVSYAWITLSTTPVAEGMQITIGGGYTILVAPDVSETVGGEVFHYPGAFDYTIRFSAYQQYDYLKQLNALAPVSTADGVNWFIPAYYSAADPEVLSGQVMAGSIKPIEQFRRDDNLSFANLTDGNDTLGHYAYIDFWVVAPGADFTLRVSQGDEKGGSYLLETMIPTVDEEGKYTLASTTGGIASSARIGFLTDDEPLSDRAWQRYKNSLAYQEQYTALRGSYNEKGQAFSGNSRFTIYEPNGDLHPTGKNGTYDVTMPLGHVNGKIARVDIRDRLTVQLQNRWKIPGENELSLEEVFQTAIAGKNISSVLQAKNELYTKFLQGQFQPYIHKGDFIKSTENLYRDYYDDNSVSMEEMEALTKDGVTSDTYITVLKKNVPQRIRMFIWIEGQDADCVNQIGSLEFALSIELAGSSRMPYE